MKRFINFLCVVLSFCTLFAAVYCTPVSATNVVYANMVTFDSDTAEAAENVAFIPEKYNDELYQTIYDGLKSSQSEIDLTEFKISVDDIVWAYSAVFNNNPDLFYVNGGFSYNYYSETNEVAYLYPVYNFSGDDLNTYVTDYNARIETIADHFDDLSAIEAVVAVNDYLATHYEYDSYSLENDPDNAIRDAYTMLLAKRGVCQGYALLFTAIMRRLGVETTSVVSVSMNHQWNLVKPDGKWYHIDVTWDDPTGVPDGYTYHEYMLHSDAAMSERLGHFDWVRIDNSDEPCTDTTYDDWAWTETNTQLTPHNNKWYYTKNTNHGIEIIEISAAGTRIVHTHEAVWDVWGQPGYSYTESLTTASWWKNWMLYHTQDKLYCYDTVLDKVFFLCDLNTEFGYVYYLHADDGHLDYVVSESPSDFSNAIHIDLDVDAIKYNSDVNNDGRVTSTDVLILTYIVLGYSSEDDLAFDVNMDGVVDSADSLYLQQITLGIADSTVIYNN